MSKPKRPEDLIYPKRVLVSGELLTFRQMAERIHRSSSAIQSRYNTLLRQGKKEITFEMLGYCQYTDLWDLYVPVPESGCWIFTGAWAPNGYGRIGIKRKHHYAHRLSYERTYGPIPKGMDVCHKCDTRACINPAHLFVGTRKDNVDDMIAKGRGAKGSKMGMAKLSEQSVKEIRESNLSIADLSRKYEVSSSTVWSCVTRRTWRHVSV